ncbi:hypothetical protein BN961_01106 [Afipia felis]|uniref:Uncharacterized protein n=1 Tax=Afipia felis TaxID=1035 RepID=A0A090MJN1_AFIFE|nr:hypothetical protein BN961_01106 [Afipia felis]
MLLAICAVLVREAKNAHFDSVHSSRVASTWATMPKRSRSTARRSARKDGVITLFAEATSP